MDKFFDMDKIQATFVRVKNALANYSEYEAKVREATNNDPWGSSSTMMTEIANATHQYVHFTDIMGTIQKRMEEPPSSTWRQTYKALQLLEYLIKNGAEKVIDVARSDFTYSLRALLNYKYTDEKMKDQGLNIRNRAKEIIELLENSDKIRDEREKAKANRNKYTGVSSNGSSGGGGIGSNNPSYSGIGSHSKYGGFGSDSIVRGEGGFSDPAEGGYKSFKPDSPSGYRDSTEHLYNEGIAGGNSEKSSRRPSITTGQVFGKGNAEVNIVGHAKASTTPARVPAVQAVNLLDFTEADMSTPGIASGSSSNGGIDNHDEFADFQAAPPAVSSLASAKPIASYQAPSKSTAAVIFPIAGISSFPAPKTTGVGKTTLAAPPHSTTNISMFPAVSFSPRPPSIIPTAGQSVGAPSSGFAAFPPSKSGVGSYSSPSSYATKPPMIPSSIMSMGGGSIGGANPYGGAVIGGAAGIPFAQINSTSPSKIQEDPFAHLVSLSSASAGMSSPGASSNSGGAKSTAQGTGIFELNWP